MDRSQNYRESIQRTGSADALRGVDVPVLIKNPINPTLNCGLVR
jgi:hypothetical protein